MAGPVRTLTALMYTPVRKGDSSVGEKNSARLDSVWKLGKAEAE